MTVFLKGRKLWRYVTSSIPKPIPNPKSKAIAAEDASKIAITMDDYKECLEEWKSIQSKILSWFINTYIPSIHNLLPRLETAEAAWKFLADRYNCTNDSSLEFHIESKLYQMRQETGQSISDFYSQTSTIWNNSLLQMLHWCVLRTLSSLSNIGIAINLCTSWWVYVRTLSLLGILCLAGLLLLFLMLQSRSLFFRRTIGLLITCHHLIMYWLHPLHSLPLLHSLLFHE